MTATETPPEVGPGSPAGTAARRGGTAWAWRTQFRRGLCWPLVAVLAAAGAWMLAVRTADWAASWTGLANYLRVCLLVLGPIAVAFACWQAGDERRRRMGELLGTTPMAAWRRHLLRLSTVTCAAVAGYLLIFAGATVLVAPAASYAGGRWWATLLLGLVAIVALVSVGWAVGRMVSYRLAAPVLAVACFIAVGYAGYQRGGWTQLLPPGTDLEAGRLLGGAIAGGIAFFLMVILAMFLVAAARHWWLAAIPAALAVIVAIPLSAGGSTSWWEPDLASQRPVCSDGGRVCVWNSHAGLLDAVIERAEPLLAAITTPGGPRYRLTELSFGERPGAADIPLFLSGAATLSGRGLGRPDLVPWAVANATYPDCQAQDAANPDAPVAVRMPDDTIYLPSDVARAILTQQQVSSFDQGAAQRLMADYRSAAGAARRSWLSAEIQAAKTCDLDALRRLSLGVEG